VKRGCDLLIFKDQKIAAFGSPYRDDAVHKKTPDLCRPGVFIESWNQD
jgi:hypothetical protein